jgi:hypothetical protein
MPDREDEGSVENYEDWKQRREAGGESPKEMFRQISHIAQFMSHDLLDKIQWWEKETLKLSEEEVDKRIPQMSVFLEQLKLAYETFSDVDL